MASCSFVVSLAFLSDSEGSLDCRVSLTDNKYGHHWLVVIRNDVLEADKIEDILTKGCNRRQQEFARSI